MWQVGTSIQCKGAVLTILLAGCFQVSAPAIAGLCGLQKRWRGGGGSSSGDSEFAECDNNQ